MILLMCEHMNIIRNGGDRQSLREDVSAVSKIWSVAEPHTQMACPLFVSAVSAGFPSPAEEYVEGKLDLNQYFVRRPAATFFVRVSGDSMVGAGILENDVLIVDRSLEAKSGQIVIAAVLGELTVKRLYQKGDCVELRPENENYPVVKIRPTMDFSIWGVVTGVARKYGG